MFEDWNKKYTELKKIADKYETKKKENKQRNIRKVRER